MSGTSERQTRFDLKTIIETSRLLVESHDLDFILNNLLLICMGKLMTPKAVVLFQNKEQDEYKVVKAKGTTRLQVDSHLHLPLSELTRGQTIVDLHQHDDHEIASESDIRWIFPIRTSNELIGYLGLGNRRTEAGLSPHELEFLESITILSATGISNSNLFNRLRQTNRQMDLKVQELRTLFELSKEFNATIDRSQILQTFKFALMGQFFIRTFVMVMKHSDGSVSLPASSGLHQHFTDEELGAVFEAGDRVRQVTPQLKNAIPGLHNNRIEALIPLRYEDEFNAVVGIGRRAGNDAYSEADFEFIQSVGNLTLLSIQKTYLLEEQVEKRRIEEDLNLARQIQLKLLPESAPEAEGLDIFGKNLSSRQIGGDYYDILTDDGNTHFAIADVTGKGVPASLLMANLQSMFQVLVPLDLDMSQCMQRLNEILYHNTTSDKFITFFWGCIDKTHRRITYSNAGHNPPLLFRSQDDTVEELSEGGLLLGAMPTMSPYGIGSVTCRPGDVIVLYTDGVTEAMNKDEEEYGDERLKQCIQKVKHHPAPEIWEAVTHDVTRFSGDDYGDDLTMLIIRFTE